MISDTINSETIDGVGPGEITLIRGANFSGRTNLLRSFTGLNVNNQEGESNDINAYIGPDIYNALSGLAGTTHEELRLHANSTTALTASLEFIGQLGFEHLLSRNPFTLSGGEQALLAVAAAVALAPRRLGIDCAFEQIDAELRSIAFDHIWKGCAANTSAMIADNRFEEYESVSSWRNLELSNPRQDTFGSLADPCEVTPKIAISASIELKNLTFAYPGGPTILRDNSICLEPGRIYWLDGRNGSGKSTLAKLLSGVIRPVKGQILFGGKESKPWKTPGQFAGYHFQAPDTQLFGMTVREELELSARRRPTAGSFTIAELASMFGLTGVLSEHPLDLPFVVRKRVALAATLALPASWFILDEPTLGQDQRSMETIATITNLVASHGAGIIIITHSNCFPTLLRSPLRLRLSDGVLSSR